MRCDSIEFLAVGYFYLQFSAHFPVLIENIFTKHSELLNSLNISHLIQCISFCHTRLPLYLLYPLLVLCSGCAHACGKEKGERTVLLIFPSSPPQIKVVSWIPALFRFILHAVLLDKIYHLVQCHYEMVIVHAEEVKEIKTIHVHVKLLPGSPSFYSDGTLKSVLGCESLNSLNLL